MISLQPIRPGMRIRWNDPDEGICSHEGIVSKCTEPIEDFIVVIHMEDGWCCECLRPELEILDIPDLTPESHALS